MIGQALYSEAATEPGPAFDVMPVGRRGMLLAPGVAHAHAPAPEPATELAPGAGDSELATWLDMLGRLELINAMGLGGQAVSPADEEDETDEEDEEEDDDWERDCMHGGYPHRARNARVGRRGIRLAPVIAAPVNALAEVGYRRLTLYNPR